MLVATLSLILAAVNCLPQAGVGSQIANEGEHCGGRTAPADVRICAEGFECLAGDRNGMDLDQGGFCTKTDPNASAAVVRAISAKDFLDKDGIFDVKPKFANLGESCGGLTSAENQSLCIDGLICAAEPGTEMIADKPGTCQPDPNAAPPPIVLKDEPNQQLQEFMGQYDGQPNISNEGETCGGYTTPEDRRSCADGLVCTPIPGNEMIADLPGTCQKRDPNGAAGLPPGFQNMIKNKGFFAHAGQCTGPGSPNPVNCDEGFLCTPAPGTELNFETGGTCQKIKLEDASRGATRHASVPLAGICSNLYNLRCQEGLSCQFPTVPNFDLATMQAVSSGFCGTPGQFGQGVNAMTMKKMAQKMRPRNVMPARAVTKTVAAGEEFEAPRSSTV